MLASTNGKGLDAVVPLLHAIAEVDAEVRRFNYEAPVDSGMHLASVEETARGADALRHGNLTFVRDAVLPTGLRHRRRSTRRQTGWTRRPSRRRPRSTRSATAVIGTRSMWEEGLIELA